MYQIEFYETTEGKQPVTEFLDSLDVKMAAKLFGLIDILEERGYELREPYSSPIGDGIFELRCILGNNITRVMYFFFVGKKIIITNGFVKKTKKTPPGEIRLAKARRKDWLERNNTQIQKGKQQ